MEEHEKPPDLREDSDLDTELRLLLDQLKTAGEEARRIVRHHPGLAAIAALLTGIWLGTKLGK